MRRLPVYFLIDVSESMAGEPLEQVQEGIAAIVKELRADPYALETVWLGIVVFAGKAKTILPLTDIIQFYPVKLPIGSGTNLGAGLRALEAELDKSLLRTTAESKGDWKPIVFLFTDGRPTDNPQQAIENWKKKYGSSSFFISISFGKNTDGELLSSFSENNLTFDASDKSSFSKFFKWVTASIRSTSQSIADGNNQIIDLSKDPNKVISKNPGEPAGLIDENVAVFLAKCQSNRRPYLIKYAKALKQSEIPEFDFETMYFRLNGAYPVEEESYSELSDNSPSGKHISSEELLGFPACPHCGNQFGFSTCACGNILCTGDEEITTCPWCSVQAKFGFGGGQINLNRGRG
jgi:uncharacterized protein YegL